MPNYPDTAYCTIAPDWVCEVVSPSTRQIDLGPKRDIYAREGVGYLWFLDPDARTLEAFELEEGQWLPITSLSDDDAVSVPPFDAIGFDLAGLWIPAPDSRKDISIRQQRVVKFVSNNPGKTQLEIAEGIYGPDAVQQHVNQDVNLCLQLGLFRREGMGGQNDPYRYYPKD